MFRDTLCVTTLLKKFWNASNIKVVYSQRHVDIPMKFSGRIIRLPTIGDVSKSNTALDRSRRKGSSRAEGNGYTEGCFLGRPEERGRSLDRCPVGNRRVVLPVVYEQGRSCSTLVSSSSTLFLSLFLSLFLLFSSLLFSSDLVSLFLRVLSLQLCRGSTILSRGSVVDRYFVPAEDLVLTFPAPHREYLCRPTGMVVEGGSVACLFVCFPSASPNTAGKPACPLTRLKIFRHPVCTLCSKLLEFAQ